LADASRARSGDTALVGSGCQALCKCEIALTLDPIDKDTKACFELTRHQPQAPGG